MLTHLRSVLLTASMALLSAACGAPAAAPAAAPSAAPASSTEAPPAPIASFREESFGPLSLGMKSAELVRVLGEPESRPPFEEMAATGERIAEWAWPTQGVSAMMSDGADGPVLVSLTLTAPSELRANYGGVGLGSTRDEVLAAYADVPVAPDDDPRESPDRPDHVRLGNPYECLSFRLTDGRVTVIFLGSTGAE